MAHQLDQTDWKILRELQDDARITNVELARRVGISPPPCLRRVRAMEESGIITGYRTIVDIKALGYDVVAFAFVGLVRQNEQDLQAFGRKVAGWPIVRECHILSGDIDFLLKCVTRDLSSFQSFVVDELTAAENVDHVRTALTIRSLKDEAGLPPSG
ncbi:MAG TPA: Lrp/AsnC family transcriptional regulator [Afifellaceae bacterium]|nr:Lrp/AsnC family transcriptional regulator [Afifellaceae bacterium]